MNVVIFGKRNARRLYIYGISLLYLASDGIGCNPRQGQVSSHCAATFDGVLRGRAQQLGMRGRSGLPSGGGGEGESACPAGLPGAAGAPAVGAPCRSRLAGCLRKRAGRAVGRRAGLLSRGCSCLSRRLRRCSCPTCRCGMPLTPLLRIHAGLLPRHQTSSPGGPHWLLFRRVGSSCGELRQA